ncbi:restriction endonuclease subunit S [Phocaeicola vulgatus]|uniref:restriction endonuclease subunit S n=1 Tax=Phocaeicola vulgatus TaxID=821 RepID=UPI0021AB0395|nr:restriction endonuclease subunit S [Phocaeicola vulgatus]
MEDIAYVASGSTPDKTCFVENGVPYIKMYNLRNQKIDFAYHPQYITEEVHNGKLQRSRTEVGDLIMNIVGPPLGKLAIIPTTLPQANFNQAAVLIRPYKFKEVLVSYLKVYLEEMSEINSIATRGSAGQVNISLTQSQNMRIPIPPLNEVRRIIEEVSKYDILIDSLKQNITDIQNLIAYTKSKILDLAIHGKLVPQDPNDELAIELLKRINPDFTPCDNGHSRKLPQGWAYCQLSNVLKITMGQSPKGDSLNNKRGIEFHQGKICFSDKFLLESGIFTNEPTKIAEPNSILLCVRAPVGVVNITKNQICIGRGLCALTPFEGNVDFYFYLLQTLQDSFDNQSTGTTFKAISGEIIRNENIILPPLAEQQRIVQKIEELFHVFDNIQNALEV